MRRLTMYAVCLLSSVPLAGCSMGQSACDYASPVVSPTGQPQGGFWYRQDSSLAGNVPMKSYGPTVAPSSGTPTPAEPTPAAPIDTAAPSGDSVTLPRSGRPNYRLSESSSDTFSE
jgi:hypothetical protein